MTDKEIGEIVLLLKFMQQIDYLRLNRTIKGRGRFIQHHQIRTHDHCTGDCDPLTLPPGKLMGIAIAAARINPNLPQHLYHLLLPFRFTAQSMGFKTLFHNILNGKSGTQRTIGILKNHLHSLAQHLQLG